MTAHPWSVQDSSSIVIPDSCVRNNKVGGLLRLCRSLSSGEWKTDFSGLSKSPGNLKVGATGILTHEGMKGFGQGLGKINF